MSLLLGLVMLSVGQAPVEKEVVFKGAGGMELHGTLTMPARIAVGGSPGVLLLPGSGPTDRNGNQPSATPPGMITNVLKEISANLALHGIATLRFDKRAAHTYFAIFAKMKVPEMSEFFKWENFVDDATAAYRFLGNQSGVDAKRVAILGHSEGAIIALQIGSNLANDPTPPAAIVTMGGTGRPMGPVIREQVERALDRQKMPVAMKKTYMDYVDKANAQLIKDATIPPDAPPGLGALYNVTAAKLLQSYLSIDPTVLAKNYNGPVLILNGAHDTQVSPDRDAPKLKEALQQRNKGTVEMLIVPDASHNFKSTSGGNDDMFTGPVVDLAMAKIDQFLVKQLHP